MKNVSPFLRSSGLPVFPFLSVSTSGPVVAIGLAFVLTGCDDASKRSRPAGAHVAVVGSKDARALAPLEAPSAAFNDAAPEGASSAEAVFVRAQDLLEKRDFVGLVHTVRPDTRRRWTSDLTIAFALDSIDDGTDPDIGRRNAKAQARRLLKAFGATASVDHAEVNVRSLGERLFDHVRDPDGLLAAMWGFADGRGCGFDPLCALGPSGIDGVVRPDESRASRPGGLDTMPSGLARDGGAPRSLEPSPKVSIPAGGVVRLFERVRAPHKLQDVSFHGEDGVGMTGAPDFLPIRFFSQDGITWLDES